ncbi:MAG: BNR repeat-containing protein [Phycisphaerae bacterium]|nr:BNR repeat-containing protein [Phycisphaerae bacterium]
MQSIRSHSKSTASAFWLILLSLTVSALTQAQTAPRVTQSLDISPVWSGHRVGFALLTQGDRQYVAYYNQDRQMTVASRTLDSNQWHTRTLDSHVAWDSHNYIAMTLDAQGFIHVSGNMHCVPLIYFRTTRPYDISTFKRIPSMTGELEARCTYPRFFTGAGGELIFTYRDGGSGNGNQIYNVYDVTTQSWRRLLDSPLTNGQGLMNAYLVGPHLGPDHYFHLCWVWRDTPDCATNHDISYARSKDLVHWETAAGDPIVLPMTLQTKGLIVDPVPAKGGIINGNTRIGFDSQNRPIVSYHKYDGAGVTQLYNARLEQGQWKIYQTSDWTYRWAFEGGGSIPFEIHVSPVVLRADGTLTQAYSHRKHGSGTWQLDEATLKPIGRMPVVKQWPPSLSKPESTFPGMEVRWQSDAGTSGEPETKYVLRWETLGPNRDRPRDSVPEPTMLRLYKIQVTPR